MPKKTVPKRTLKRPEVRSSEPEPIAQMSRQKLIAMQRYRLGFGPPPDEESQRQIAEQTRRLSQAPPEYDEAQQRKIDE